MMHSCMEINCIFSCLGLILWLLHVLFPLVSYQSADWTASSFHSCFVWKWLLSIKKILTKHKLWRWQFWWCVCFPNGKMNQTQEFYQNWDQKLNLCEEEQLEMEKVYTSDTKLKLLNVKNLFRFVFFLILK